MDQHEEQTEDEVFSLPEDGLLDGTEDFSELAPDGHVKDALDDEEDVFSLPDTALIEEPVVLTNGESPAIAEPEVTEEPAGLSSSQTGEEEAESFELSAEDMVESAEDILGQESEQQEKSLDELLDSLEEISQDKVSVSEEDSSATESRPSISKASETLSEMIDNVRGLQELAHSQEDSVDQDSTSNQDESVDSGIAAEPETSEEEATPVVQNEPNGNGLSHPEETANGIHSADPADAEIDAIVAEPEDLLQQIMPSSTLVSLQKRARPESIRESLSYLSRLSSKEKQQTASSDKRLRVS